MFLIVEDGVRSEFATTFCLRLVRGGCDDPCPEQFRQLHRFRPRRSRRSVAVAATSSARLLGTTSRRPVSTFREDWITNWVLNVADLLDQDVFRVAEIANANQPLRDTVIAFSESDMSITRCARTSHLHANTVVYRLGRWRELTGWDP
ncbi:helix-turn-helix domain-containing protein [Rhodococcus pyridinivorans]